MITRNMNITKGRLSLERQICRTGSIDNSTKYKASAPWRLRWHRVHLNQGDLAAPMAQSPPATRETWRLRWQRIHLQSGRPGFDPCRQVKRPTSKINYIHNKQLRDRQNERM